MEEQVDQGDGGETTPPVVDDGAALLDVNKEEPRRRYERYSRGCSRAVHCSLTLPFLLIVGLVIFSVATFYANQDRVGGCVLFGKIDRNKKVLQRGPSKVCLTVTGGEVVLCAFAILFAIIMVVKAFRHSRMLTLFVFIELFLVFVIFLLSVGISSIMNIGINNTCASMMHKAPPTPDFAECGNIKVNTDNDKPMDRRHPVWDTLLQESLIASWICTLIYLVLVFIWVLLSLFTCCAIQSRKSRKGRGRRINVEEGMPIMQEPNVVYGAT